MEILEKERVFETSVIYFSKVKRILDANNNRKISKKSF